MVEKNSLKQGFFMGILIALLVSGIELFNTIIVKLLGGGVEEVQFLSRFFLTFLLFLILLSFIVIYPEAIFLKKREYNRYLPWIVGLWFFLLFLFLLIFIVWAFRSGELRWL